MIDANVLSALIAASVAALITVIGWITNYWLERKRDFANRQQDLEIAYLERQIEELYGPLWGLIEQSKAIYDVTCFDLPRYKDGRLARDKFTKNQKRTYNYIKENYFIPIHQKITEIINSKMHLINGSEVPPSFLEFIRYAALFQSSFRLLQDMHIDHLDLEIMEAKWPEQFTEDTKNTLEALRNRHREYFGKGKKSKATKTKIARAMEAGSV